MTADTRSSSCEEFQAKLADLIGSGEAVGLHPHLQTCANCRALLADLLTIADAAKEPLAVEQPKEDLWDRIKIAIKKDEETM